MQCTTEQVEPVPSVLSSTYWFRRLTPSDLVEFTLLETLIFLGPTL